MTIAIFATVIFYIGNLQPVGNSDKFMLLYFRKIGNPDILQLLQILQ